MDLTPVFPLNCVVCPGGRLPLRIFETRYLDMVSRSLREQSGFVITLHDSAAESDEHPYSFFSLGTLVKIIDFAESDQQGILNIVVAGETRVHLSEIDRQEDGLWIARKEDITDIDGIEVPLKWEDLKAVLRALEAHPAVQDLGLDIDYDNGQDVSWRLTELLPVGNREKQALLGMDDPLCRLERIAMLLSKMAS